MPSTYTSGLGLEKVANGEQASSWGSTTNENLDYIDKAFYGNASVTLSSTSYTLDIQDGASCTARNAFLTFTGSPGGNVTVTLTPNTYQRVFMVKNATSYTLTFTQGSGGNLDVPAGSSAMIVANGAGAGSAVIGGTISPLVELQTFKTTGGSPSMDGVGRIYRDANGMCYDGLTHRFDVSSGPGRIRGLTISTAGNLSSDGNMDVNRMSTVSYVHVGANATIGYVKLNPGDATHVGYMEWVKADQTTRLGYFGYNNTDVELTLENSAKFKVTGGNVECSGNVKAASLTVGSNSITYAASIPTGSGTKGDVCFNSNVTAGGNAGWICLGGTSWKAFGIVAA